MPYKFTAIGQERRNKIIMFMYMFRDEYSFMPSIREIAEHVGITSTSLVNYYLTRLQAEGWINHKSNTSRGTTLTIAGDNLARALLNFKSDICSHCGAPIDETGKYKPHESKKKHRTAERYKQTIGQNAS